MAVTQTKRRTRNPLVISITSGKGGVGKTTLSVNMGVQLVERGRRVLLIDGDLGLANVDIMFGIRPMFTFQHLLSGERSIEEIIVKGPGGIRILPASSGITEVADLNPDVQMHILNQLETLESNFDVILIDTAAGIGSNVLHFAAAAQYVTVVVTPEPTSLADSYAVIKVLRERYNVQRFQLVVTNAENERSALRVYQTLTDVADNFIDVVIDYLGAIPRDMNITSAIKAQRPVIEMFPSSPASVAVRKLAETMLTKRGRGLPGESEPLFWSRIIE